MHLAPSQRTLDKGARPSFCAGRKLGEVEQALLWALLHQDSECPSRVLLDKVAQRQRPLAVSLCHRNRWRALWQLNRRKGRPHQVSCPRPVASGAAVVRITPPSVVCGRASLAAPGKFEVKRLGALEHSNDGTAVSSGGYSVSNFAGSALFAHWLDQQGLFGLVVAQLTQAAAAYKHTHPDDDFALLHHREQMLQRRVQALLLAPLFGIDHLTAFATHEHPLPTRLDTIADLRQRFGWKAFVTHAGHTRLSLQDAVLCYRNEYRVERIFNRLKSRVHIAPLFVKLNAQIEGLTYLLTLGVRVLTVMAFVLRRSLEHDQASLPGLHPENKQKRTDKPTAERILKAFADVSLTIIKNATGEEILRRLTPLSALQEEILQRLGLGASLYGQLEIQTIGN